MPEGYLAAQFPQSDVRPVLFRALKSRDRPPTYTPQLKNAPITALERAEGGEDIVIARNGKPVARLVPVRSASSLTSVRGVWRGRVHLSEDFDKLPADIADAFGAR